MPFNLTSAIPRSPRSTFWVSGCRRVPLRWASFGPGQNNPQAPWLGLSAFSRFRSCSPSGFCRRGGAGRLRSPQNLRQRRARRNGAAARKLAEKSREVGKETGARATSGTPDRVKDLSVFIEPVETRSLPSEGGFDIEKGETVALVGESGSGKSVPALSIRNFYLSHGLASDRFHPVQRRGTAGRRSTPVAPNPGRQYLDDFQEPLSLNPLHGVGNQVAEVLTLHRPLSKKGDGPGSGASETGWFESQCDRLKTAFPTNFPAVSVNR